MDIKIDGLIHPPGSRTSNLLMRGRRREGGREGQREGKEGGREGDGTAGLHALLF